MFSEQDSWGVLRPALLTTIITAGRVVGVRWLFCTFIGGFLLEFGLNWFGLREWSATEGRHWTERSAILYPLRAAAASNLFFSIPTIAGALALLYSSELWFLCALLGFLGAVAGSYFFDRGVYPKMTFAQWIRITVAHLVLQTTVVITLGAGTWLMPAAWTPRAWLTAAATMSLIAAGQFGFYVWLLRQLGLFRPATGRILDIVARVSARQNVPVRHVWVIDSVQYNAMAFVQTGDLGFTAPFIGEFPEEEIEPVVAHEIGHLKETPAQRASRLLMVAWVAPILFLRPLSSFFGPPGALAAIGLMVWVIRRLVRMVSRALEKRADQFAISDSASPTAYAKALEHLDRLNFTPAVLPVRTHSHPSLYDRMLACGLVPDFPRPDPPATQHWSSLLPAITAGILAAAALFKAFPQ